MSLSPYPSAHLSQTFFSPPTGLVANPLHRSISPNPIPLLRSTAQLHHQLSSRTRSSRSLHLPHLQPEILTLRVAEGTDTRNMDKRKRKVIDVGKKKGELRGSCFGSKSEGGTKKKEKIKKKKRGRWGWGPSSSPPCPLSSLEGGKKTHKSKNQGEKKR